MAAVANQAVCPVIGATATVLPPGHPEYDHNDPEAKCPVTNAKVAHHGDEIIHKHEGLEGDAAQNSTNALQCPALKKTATDDSTVASSVCPVVGPVTDVLPPSHPGLDNLKGDEVCPVTNAKMSHHKDKVQVHPPVPNSASQSECPVVGASTRAE